MKQNGVSSLPEFLAYFLHLGSLGFGGPIALTGYMQRDLVEKRGWFSEKDFLEGLALAQLSPGPLAAQLAIYLGWLQGGSLAAALTGLAFVLPSFLMVIALGWVYLQYGGIPWMQGAFYGIGAAVIALIGRSAWKLLKLTLGRDTLLWGIFTALAGMTAWREAEIAWLFILAGVLALLVKAPPRFLKGPNVPSIEILGPALLGSAIVAGTETSGLLWRLFSYFAQAGAFVFGSGLAIVPFLYGGVVRDFHWLNDQQFLDAVAVAMITPGPVVITVAFIGYLVAGLAGASVAALGTFLPCYFFTVIPAPYFRRFAENKGLKAFVGGVTAAATGAIAGAAWILGRRAITDIPTALIALATMALILQKWKKLPEPLVILAAGLAGAIIKL